MSGHVSEPCSCRSGCDCGCCAGTEPLTPQTIANRPGLDALAYRVGTFSSFLETMKARLSSADHPQLLGLTTREASDPAIAFLDAWAVVADVLTFYQERIANEGYLRTATERRSVLELARLVGYELRPGVASSVYLAYTIEEKPKPAAALGSPAAPASASIDEPEVVVPAGARAQSVPGPGELPQPFETSQDLVARAVWNDLQVRLTRPQQPQKIIQVREHPIVLGIGVGVGVGLSPLSPALFTSVLLDSGTNVAVLQLLPATTPFKFDLDLKGEERAHFEVTGTQAAGGLSIHLQISFASRPFVVDIDVAAGQQLAVSSRGLDFTTLSTDVLPGISGDVSVLLFTRRAPLDLRGIATQLQPNDPLLIDTGSLPSPNLYRVLTVEPDAPHDRTRTQVEPWRKDGLLARVPVRLDSPPPAVALLSDASAPPATTRIGDVLGSLGKPARVQPRNDLELSRDVQQLFAPDSDVPAKLLTVMRPELAGGLYAAWANVPVTAAPALQVCALRTKASVFGHNAPLELVRNEEGVIIGSKEWDLVLEVAGIKATLAAEGGGDAGGAIVLSHVITLGGSATVTDPFREVFEGFSFQLFFPDGETVVITVKKMTFDGPLLPVELEYVVPNRSLDIDVNVTPVSAGIWKVTVTGLDPATVESSVVIGSTTQVSVASGQPTEDPRVVWLDAVYPQILPGSRIVLERPTPLLPANPLSPPADPSPLVIARVVAVSQQSRAAYGLTAKSTRVELDRDWLNLAFDTFAVIRGTAVYAQCEDLPLAEEPIPDPVCGGTLELSGLYDGLVPGRWLIVSGERADVTDKNGVVVPGVPAAELAMLAGVAQGVAVDGKANPLAGERTHTTLTLAQPLAYCYRRDDLTIFGNVAPATHGETKTEVLGSGDGAKTLQSFTLRQPPLTWVSAPTPSGVQSTLEVRANDLLWHEAGSFAALGPADRGYVTRTDDAGVTTAVFGNGVHGARLPTGTANVRAKYRAGIGRPGNVKAGQISQLATRPLGVKAVVNPLAASGGADRESRDQARANAPLAVMSLDRLVSVQDYADFARTFAGVGKASAVRLTNGRVQLVHVTIAGVDDIPILESSDLFRNLGLALRQFGDPRQPVQLALRERLLLLVSAGVKVLPDFEWETVEPRIRAALLDAFGYPRRDLGQPAFLSAVYRTIQSVRGVDFADVDVFDQIVGSVDPEALAIQAANLAKDQPKDFVAAKLARVEKGELEPAQLVYLSPEVPDTLILKERKS